MARGSDSEPDFELHRIYEAPSPHAGYRVLVDRLWPRGISKVEAALDEWAKDIAPSTELRRWYGHDQAKFRQFARRYGAELRRSDAEDTLSRLRAVALERTVILLTATHDVEHSGAVVLLDQLSGRIG